MKIVGHRGAAGVALENTLESIRAALAGHVSEVEIDVRLTSDRQFVLSHDANLQRVSGVSTQIDTSTLANLKKIKLRNAEAIATLEEVLRLAAPHWLGIEAKGGDWAEPLAEALRSEQRKVRSVIAFNHSELVKFHKQCPDIPTHALGFFHPFRALITARRHHLTGIGIGYWLLNPLTYWLARRAGLEVYVYTVNAVWLARVLGTFYPDIRVATNYPQKLAFLADDNQPG